MGHRRQQVCPQFFERGEPTHELRLTGECGLRVLLAERGQEESALTSVSGDANEAQP